MVELMEVDILEEVAEEMITVIELYLADLFLILPHFDFDG